MYHDIHRICRCCSGQFSLPAVPRYTCQLQFNIRMLRFIKLFDYIISTDRLLCNRIGRIILIFHWSNQTQHNLFSAVCLSIFRIFHTFFTLTVFCRQSHLFLLVSRSTVLCCITAIPAPRQKYHSCQ